MYLLASFLSYPFIAILRGFVMAKLWGWVVVPTFGLAPISIPAAFGLALIVTYLTATLPERQEQPKELGDFVWESALRVIFALFVLLVGFITSLFIGA